MPTDPLLERALLDTNLKLGPQASALRSLLSDLAGQYSRTRRVNASNALGISAATRQARPEVGGAFAQALASSQAQRAALGVGGQDPQAAAFERRVGEQRAGALNDLTQRELRATEGRVYANNAARDEYLGGKSKIMGQLQELAGQSGALTASTLGQLRDDRAQRSLTRSGQRVTEGNSIRSQQQSERNSIRSSGIDPDTGRPIPGGKQDKASRGTLPGGAKVASQAAHSSAKDNIDGALTWIKRLSQGTFTSKEIRDMLQAGGEVDVGQATPLKVPRFSKDFVNAAYDIEVLGGLSRTNVRALHRRGLKIRSLGYPTRKAGDQGPRTQTQTQRELDVVRQGIAQQTGG
jgi:hypothetical protein